MASGIEWKLQQGEDSFTEFKGVAQSGYDLSPQDLAKEIVALANTKGGSVLIGVEDDGTASGVGDLQSVWC